MQWNADFDICALIILIAILFLHVSKRYIPIRRSRIFLSIVVNEMAAVLCGMAIRFLWFRHGGMPWRGMTALIALFYMIQYCVPIIFMNYMIAWSCQSPRKSRLATGLWLIPILVYAVVMIQNCLYQNLYVLDEQCAFVETQAIFILYMMAFYCVLYGMIYAVVYARPSTFQKQIIIALLVLIMGVSTVVQIHISQMTFIDFMLAVCLLLMYFTVQNPSDMLDDETQVFSRNMMDELLSIDIDEKHAFNLIVLALDDFKFVNKTFGISTGDMMLLQVAHFLLTLTKSGRVYRYGADQIAMKVRPGERDIETLLDDIQERFRHPWITEEISVMLSTTISCVEYPADGEELESIYDVIDYSVLAAKKKGKGSVVFAKELDLHNLRREKAIEKAVERAMNQNTIEVYYQPIFNTEKNGYTSAEALVRLYDEELGNISPEIFIPIVEKNGMIIRLGTMIFEKVCRFIAENNLKDTSIEYIEVNVSVVQCMQQDFVRNLLDVMEQYHIEPGQINLEVTETAAVNSLSILKENIEKLYDKGISFSLDDYGSGYSTLGYLHQLPFKIIKLDKLVVWDAFENEKAGITLKFTVGMLKELQVRIVAEGVETMEQQQHLTGIGCDYLQGWYYSKAVPAQEFINLIRQSG